MILGPKCILCFYRKFLVANKNTTTVFSWEWMLIGSRMPFTDFFQLTPQSYPETGQQATVLNPMI